MLRMNAFGRMAVCGLISGYDGELIPMTHPQLILQSRLLVRGFIVTDFAAKFTDFIREVPQWIGQGRIKYREDIADGLENAPATFIGLLKGKNFGKQLVRVAE